MKSQFRWFGILLVLCCILSIILSGCLSEKINMLQYYSDVSNYSSATGVVTGYKFANDGSLCIYIHDTIPEYPDTSFELCDVNVHIAEERGLLLDLRKGVRVEFTSAQRIYYNGYLLPIVAISIDGKEYLSADEGIPNLLEWLKKNA